MFLSLNDINYFAIFVYLYVCTYTNFYAPNNWKDIVYA